jgi:tetratricopeptide (TPR) repeat protein
MHDDHASTPLSYSAELELASQLLTRDPKHALHHCIGALALQPQRREWHVILRELLAGGELRRVLEQDTFFASKAALAWHMHERGELAEALDLIGAVAGAVPHLGFQQWFGVWLEEAAAARAEIDAGTVLRVLLLGTSFGIGRIRLLPAEQAAARELAPIARFAAESLRDAQVYMLASSVLRRAGDNAAAVAMAEHARDAGAELAQVATVVGLALRAAGDPVRAIDVFDGAFQVSRDVIYLQEKFRALVDAGRWQEAADLAKTITASKPPDGESQLEYAFVERALRDKLPVPSAPPLDHIRRQSLGHGQLFAMGDATANVLRQIIQSKPQHEIGETIRTMDVSTAVQGHEGASNRLCMALVFKGSTDPRVASYSNDKVMRMVRDHADQYTLWKQDGDVVVQALPVPPAAVLDYVEALAEPRGEDFLALWERGRANVPAAMAREWVAATVHPRMPVACVHEGPAYLYRAQVCALIGLAHSEPGWDGTQKRDAFLSLLRGVIDWPMAAAIRVAAEIAMTEPSAMHEVRLTLIDLIGPLEDLPNAAIPGTLLYALEMLPFVGKDYTEKLSSSLAARDADAPDDRDDDDDEPAPEPEPEPAKKPWWKVWGKN